MELLVAQNLGRLHEGAELLANINLRLSASDRVGLAGTNGSGKSSLLRLLAGREPADSGHVWRAPGVRLGYLPQKDAGNLTPPSMPDALEATLWQTAQQTLSEVAALEARMRAAEQHMAERRSDGTDYEALRVQFERAGGYGATASLRRELAAFSFTHADDARPISALSSGERRRLALAMTLAANPDVLLLDEPTNHLDIHARLLLVKRLSAWPGALVVVSHDRALLDACTQRTAFLEPPRSTIGGPSLWSVEIGNYSAARARRDAALRTSHKRERERQRESERLAKMAAELATFGKKAAARRRGAERQLSRLRLAGVMAPAVSKSAEPRLATVTSAAQRTQTEQELVRATALSAQPVLQDAQAVVRRGQRIALLGPNGSGKSTLLDLLAGERRSQDPRAEVRYLHGLRLRRLSQEGRGLVGHQPLWDQATARVGTVAAGRLLAGAGLPASLWSRPPDQLSGGQRARAGLALALSDSADIWLIDEPTNDLDLSAVEALEQQLLLKLEESNSALILATHDQRLAETLCTEVWAVEHGAVAHYSGVQAYLTGGRQAPVAVQDDDPHADQDPTAEQDRTAGPGRTEGQNHTPSPGTTAGKEAGRTAPGGVASAAPDAASTAAPSTATAQEEEQKLEDQRARLLRLRDEEPSLTERDRQRLQQMLNEVESQLMDRYDARLPLPAPRYRVIEMGMALYADRLDESRVAVVASLLAPRAVAVTATEAAQSVESVHEPVGVPLGSAATGALVAAQAIERLRHGHSGPLELQELLVPAVGDHSVAPLWLEVRLEGKVGHLRFIHAKPGSGAEPGTGSEPAPGISHQPLPVATGPGDDLAPDTCATGTSTSRSVRTALANAGVRLAFTRLGAQVVQLHEPSPLPGTVLKDATEGWWTLSLDEFLASEGWRRPKPSRKRRPRRQRGKRA